MSKRLEEAKHLMPILCDLCTDPSDVTQDEVERVHDIYQWLIAQAERAEMLQQEAGSNRAAIHMALTYLGSGRYEDAENILDTAFNREATMTDIEQCAQIAEKWEAAYPVEVFTEPPPGEHGDTVDACSARAGRKIAAGIARDIRALKEEAHNA